MSQLAHAIVLCLASRVSALLGYLPHSPPDSDLLGEQDICTLGLPKGMHLVILPALFEVHV